ncbi:MAG TPA: ATP-binding protein [Gaiellaceae bacterium]|jgi:signal transduction histidine kinase
MRFRRRRPEAPPSPPTSLRAEVERGRRVVEESRELLLVLDDEDRLVAASRRAREVFEQLTEGEPVPPEVLAADGGQAFSIDYEVAGRHERLLYLRSTGDLAAYEELRAGFTAAVSHELRTPLARLLAILESAELPGEDVSELIDQARAEVGQIGELIDDVLFLSELETGRQVVGLGTTRALPILVEAAESFEDRAARAGMEIRIEGDEDAELPLRPRMMRVVLSNLAGNAVRYAGPGATVTLSVRNEDDEVILAASDDGSGVAEEDLPRLFERFYRADRSRTTRGTGLGLAIVKHIVSSAGGTVEAAGARGAGLTIRCRFPASGAGPGRAG